MDHGFHAVSKTYTNRTSKNNELILDSDQFVDAYT